MTEEIIKLVNESFLSEKEKSILIKIIEKDGLTETFFEKFRILLVDEIKKISVDYKNAIRDLNAGFEESDSWLEEQKKELESDTEKQLSKIDLADLKKKGKIWDDYDKKILALLEEYKKRLDELTKKLMLLKINQ